MNPAHLFLGNQSDNIADSVKKGRHVKGERVNTAKLGPADIREIRSRYAAGGITQGQLGQCFGVSQLSVSRIVRGQSWAHIT